MKKSIIYFLIIILTLNLSACGITLKAGIIKNTVEEKAVNKDIIEEGKEKLKVLCDQLMDQDEEGINNALKDFKENTLKNVEQVYFAKEEDKKFYVYPSIELPTDYDATKRIWYTGAKENEYYISEYEDVQNEKKIITLAKAFYKNDKLLGVAGMDLIIEE